MATHVLFSEPSDWRHDVTLLSLVVGCWCVNAVMEGSRISSQPCLIHVDNNGWYVTSVLQCTPGDQDHVVTCVRCQYLDLSNPGHGTESSRKLDNCQDNNPYHEYQYLNTTILSCPVLCKNIRCRIRQFLTNNDASSYFARLFYFLRLNQYGTQYIWFAW